jgi:sulfonate transport system substrate-binding protein
MHRRTFAKGAGAAAAAALLGACARSSERPREIKLDWAYYSPLSMVLRRKQWVEEEFAKDGIPIRWLLSLGSNKALEFLSTGGVDFGSTAGAAALLSRTNGNRIKGVYISGRPEWTALVVAKGSTLDGVAALRGKKVAATKGTDPYIFLLRILHDAGLRKEDIDLVHLQHPDGRAALERGDVDAWAGLDPHMAFSEIEQGSRLIVRKPEYNSYSFLNVREDFLTQHPDATRRVLRAYEKARRWALQNREELLAIVGEEAKIPAPVAARTVFDRNDFHNPIPGSEHVRALTGAADILLTEGLVKEGTNPQRAIADLIDGSYAQSIAAS